MKRFYKDVGVDRTPQEYRVLLDGKPVRTPGRNALLLPTQAMAQAIAEEWRSQGEEIVPVSMPLLRMANTVLDGVNQTREAVIDAILRFGEHDLLCYRVDVPDALAARQRAEWSPLLDWMASRYDVHLAVANGVGHVQQSAAALDGLRAVVAAYDDFGLAALHVMASITGSLVLALALSEGVLNPAQAFQLSRIDEDHQAEFWGEDAEAAARARNLARELDNAAAFLAVSRR